MGATSLVLIGAVALAAQATGDPFLGKWRMDPEKSVFSPGPVPLLQEAFYEDTGDGAVKLRSTSHYPDGPRFTMTWTARFDGKEYPVTGSPLYDTIAYRRLDTHTVEFTLRKDGKVVSHGRRVLAADGKSYTNYAEGIDEKGRPFKNASVYVKRDPFLGTWQLDTAAGNTNASGRNRAVSITATYSEAPGGAVHFKADVVYPEQSFTMSWTAKTDGAEYPVSGTPMYDTVVYKPVDARTVEFTLKKAGKVISHGRRVLAEDEMSYTNHAERTEPDGTRSKGEAVYRRIR